MDINSDNSNEISAIGRVLRNGDEGGNVPALSPDELLSIIALANEGDEQSQLKLSLAYFKGAGVEKSLEKSIRWLKKLAMSGNSLAQLLLSYRYKKGEGVPCDQTISYQWLYRAAQAGQIEAQFMLARELETKARNADDLTVALTWYLISKDISRELSEDAISRVKNSLTPEKISFASKSAETWVASTYKEIHE